jgi:hypothetical protein
MGERRPKKRYPRGPISPSVQDVFAACGLNAADFEVQYGGGKSFLSKQRLVWMTVTHRPTGRKVSGKIGTLKRRADHQRNVLLRELLQSFRRP